MIERMFENGDIVDYDINGMTGKGYIIGIAGTKQPVIGRSWIIKDIDTNFPNDEYPYEAFVCFEFQIRK
jgi:hypothetical protein